MFLAAEGATVLHQEEASHTRFVSHHFGGTSERVAKLQVQVFILSFPVFHGLILLFWGNVHLSAMACWNPDPSVGLLPAPFEGVGRSRWYLSGDGGSSLPQEPLDAYAAGLCAGPGSPSSTS